MKQLLLVAISFLVFHFSAQSQTNVCSGTYTTTAASCQAIQIGNGTTGSIRVCISNNSIPSGGGTSCSPGGSCNPPYSGGGWSARMVIYASTGSGYTGAALQTWTATTGNNTCYTVST